MFYRTALFATMILLVTVATSSAALNPSYSEKAVIDTVPFYENGEYDSSIPKLNDFLKQPLGQWPLRYDELVAFLKAVDEKSDRVTVRKVGESFEGRATYSVFVSSPENMAKLDRIREAMAVLADPSRVSGPGQLDSLVKNLPAVAWMGYSVHGDEISGVDAGALLAYQLAAGTDEPTLNILKNVVVIIDPIENPDGRERYLSMLEMYKSNVPNYDMFALQHRGSFPGGRTNHYMFDLNRDMLVVTQPETKGKAATIREWHPQLVVDGHEMGSDGNFLMSPPRQPINYNTPENVLKWYETFNKDQAAALDQRGWAYYSGEWNDQWFPGYNSAWVTFLGAVGILYEMAGVDGEFVRQDGDYVLTYHEAVNRQFTSSVANLKTTAENREALLRDYYDTRKSIVAQGRKSGLTFLFVPGSDVWKTKRFIEGLTDLGINVDRAKADFRVGSSTDIYGESHRSQSYPAGTYIVSTAQPSGALAKAILEFDPHLNLDFLQDERREIEKHGDTKMYEVSTWSVPLGYDIDAYWTTTPPNVATERVATVETGDGELDNADAQFGYVVDMTGEKTYVLLSKLLQKGLEVYASEKPFTVDGQSFEAGALVLRKRGNPENLAEILEPLAEETGVVIHGVNTARATEGSFLGAPTYRLLKEPSVAIAFDNGIDYTSFGTLWFTMDRQIQIPHSLIRLSDFDWMDLSRYNVLILPSSWGRMSQYISEGATKKIDKWVSDGGTLIAIGGAAEWAADTSLTISNVRVKRQVLDKMDSYITGLEREQTAEAPQVDTMALWHPEKAPASVEPEKPGKADVAELKEKDDWQRRFLPRGVYMRVNLDQEHWLSFGMNESVPAMMYTRTAFMSKSPETTVGRFADENSLRMSGLLWPEARERWANTAYLTREGKGKGQVILFAGDPDMRAYNYGTRQLFLNALLYGPGMGASSDEDYVK